MLNFQADVVSSAKAVSAIRSSQLRNRRKRLLPPGISALLVFLLTACSGGGSDPIIVGSSPTSQLKGTLVIEPDSFILTEGEGISLKAMLGSTAVGASQLSWSISPSDLATIDAYGNLTALKHGEGTVEARYTSLRATAQATVWAIPWGIEAANSLSQAGIVGRSLTDSLAVRAVSDDGTPVPGVDIDLEILTGGGVLSHAARTTGLDGVARVEWTLGTVSGDQQLRARATNLGELDFQVEALADYDSATVVPVSGDDQEGVVTDLLPEALTAQVTDQFGNVLPGLAVEWSFTDGGGLFGASGSSGNPEQVLISATDDQGMTEVQWQLGTVAGDQEAVCAPPVSGADGASGNLGGNGPSGAPKHDKARGRKWKARAKPADPDGVVVTPIETWTVVGEPETLTAVVVDPYGNVIDGNTFDWQADDSGVVSVDGGGTVVGLKAGTGQVTAESSTLDLSGAALVIVETRKPSKLNRGSGNGQKGRVGEPLPNPVGVLVVDQVGAPVPGIEVRWTAGGPDLTGADGGSLFLNSGQPGTATTVTDQNGIARNSWTLGTQVGIQTLQADVDGVAGVQFSAEATAGAVVAMSVDPSSSSIEVGQTQQFTLSAHDVYGNPVTDAGFQWGSSDPAVATVNATGLATGLAEGSTEVMAAVDGVSASASLTVSVPAERVRSLEISPPSTILEGLDEFALLTATAFDSLGTVVSDATFEWSSLDPTIATVSSGGVVTSKALGQALIVASALCCSASDTALVEVKEAVVSPGEFTVEITPATTTMVGLDETASLAVMAYDASGDPVLDIAFEWSSLNPTVATVSQGGVVTSQAVGQALIVASALCCSASDTTLVEVEEAVLAPSVSSVEISPATITLEGLETTATLTASAFDSLGEAVSDATFEWSSLNPSVVTVSQGGVVTSKALGQALIIASVACCSASDTALVGVDQAALSAPSIVTASPIATGQAGMAYSQPLTATGGDGTYSWSLFNGTTLPTGLWLVESSGEIQGTPSEAGTTIFEVEVTSGGQTASKEFSLTVSPAPQPISGDTIDLAVTRLDGGTGEVLVSSGIPLTPGLLFPGETDRVAVVVDGVEQAVYVEGMPALHPDGSLRTAFIQFRTDVGATPLLGQLIVGPDVTRTAPGIAKTPVTWDLPQAVVLPTSPDYLVSTEIVGKTIPVSAVPGLPSNLQQYESNFRTFGDSHWINDAPLLSPYQSNYYDRALIWFAWWARTGDSEYWRRAAIESGAYVGIIDYSSLGNLPAPRNQHLEGLELRFLLVGDEEARTALLAIAELNRRAWTPKLDMDPASNYMEGRIQARTLLSHLMAWRVGDTSKDWAALAREDLDAILRSQNSVDGSYDKFIVWDYLHSPYMTGLVHDVFIKYQEWLEVDGRIPPAMKAALDFQWDNMWVSGSNAFKYLESSTQGSPDLNMLIVNGYGWYARWSGDPAYSDRAEQIFSGGVYGAYLQGYKQFNQSYRSAFRYLYYRQ